MTILTNKKEIDRIKESGDVLKEVFRLLEPEVRPGVSTARLDALVEDIICSRGAEPAFKGYRGYPASICASINQVVVHGIPSEEAVLSDGDIIGIDIGVKKNGFFTDAARTFAIGKIGQNTRHLIDVTKKSLDEGIKQAIAGNRISDISNTIQCVAKEGGVKEVRSFVGHGVGKKLHEPPEVPNWGERGDGPVMEEGLVLAIEPMLNIGTRKVKVLADGWTAVTADGKLSAHFEDTIIVGLNKAEIIT